MGAKKRSGYRESELPVAPPGRSHHVVEGRRHISVIGIDRYKQWNRLDNAVNDARGVLAAFEALGFQSIAEPLLDDAATGDAIRTLPGRLAPKLHGSDSLVVFFAGHGHTVTDRFLDGDAVHKGYLIPVDACHGDKHQYSWPRIGEWLRTLAELQLRHLLVILDSCQSGIALSEEILRRNSGVQIDDSAPPSALRSRRILASALANQRAMDGGPVPGHSLFTGFLLQALRGEGGLFPRPRMTVGTNLLAELVRNQVQDYSEDRQVPAFGSLEHHNSGELRLQFGLATEPQAQRRDDAGDERMHRSAGGARSRIAPSRAPSRIRPCVAPSEPPAPPPDSAQSSPPPEPLRQRTEGWILEPGLAAALDRQYEERRRGAHVLTVVAGDALAAQTSWGTWAAQHGYLTLASESVGLEAVVADLLGQMPWLRCVPAARQRVAAAARIDVRAVDAALDARAPVERPRWIDDIAPRDPHVRVSGWLLSWLRESTASAPRVAKAPVGPAELLAIACDLAAPTTVLLFHAAPDERWLAQAVGTAAQLIPYLPAHSVAVTAPEALVTPTLAAHRTGAAWTMARQGVVRVDALARRLPGRARDTTMRVLHEALARDPRTRGRFELDATVTTREGPPLEVALLARGARIAVELDGWYHFHDPEGYRRERVQDTRLQRAGYFVLRFPSEDVDDRLASTIDQLSIALDSRRAVTALF